uniref:Metalloendopeptidase n=1 Tax=Haemonchus contortus TaxID=6289 RepID=A0A7I4XWD2_HAECO
MSFAIISMLGHILALFAVVPVVWTRAKPEFIPNNPEKGDIEQLWNLPRNGTRAYNALLQSSFRKWYLTDENGKILIPAVVTGEFSRSERVTMQDAIWRIMNNTCIRFIKRTDHKDYVDITNERGQGCSAHVGRGKGRVRMQLESNERISCIKPRAVIHELLHICGLWHEHMRHDRDNYIEILYENIPEEIHHNFIKLSPSEATAYDLPYDYESVMHYRKNDGAMPSKISIRTKDPKYQDVIGYVEDASPIDYLKVCKIYGCKKCNGES